MSARPTAATALDHVVLLVTDLDRAAQGFSQMGFVVTPESRHSIGSRNRCVMLADRSYIELLDITERRGGDSDFHELMRRGGGLAGLAFRTDSLAQTRRRLAADGIPTREIQHFSRPIGTGERMELAEFAVCHIPLEVSGDYKLFYCDQLTPDRLWTDETTAHPNGADALVGVRLAVSEPLHFATSLNSVLGNRQSAQTGTLEDAAGRRFGLEQRGPDTTGATLELTVPDCQALADRLRAKSIDHRIAANGSLSIPATAVHDVRLILSPQRPKEDTE